MLQDDDLIEGKYRVLRPIGEGGMGAVFLGENTRISRKVAIKILHSAYARNKDAVERFEREAQAAARVSSDHVVDVLDLGDLPTGERFMIMEYLEGESLAARLETHQTLKPREIAGIATQILDGLARLHAAGIVHRDLKPGNIFLSNQDGGERVKILDFGICRIQFGPDQNKTMPGTVLGTPQYMAPEQASDGVVDHRSDLYAIGVLLYRCVSGELPYDGKNYQQIMMKLVAGPPRPIEQIVPGIDADFAQIVRKAMARKPWERYQSASEFAAALRDWQTHVDRLLAEFLDLRHVRPRSSDSKPAPAANPVDTGTLAEKIDLVAAPEPSTDPERPSTSPRAKMEVSVVHAGDPRVDPPTPPHHGIERAPLRVQEEPTERNISTGPRPARTYDVPPGKINDTPSGKTVVAVEQMLPDRPDEPAAAPVFDGTVPLESEGDDAAPTSRLYKRDVLPAAAGLHELAATPGSIAEDSPATEADPADSPARSGAMSPLRSGELEGAPALPVQANPVQANREERTLSTRTRVPWGAVIAAIVVFVGILGALAFVRRRSPAPASEPTADTPSASVVATPVVALPATTLASASAAPPLDSSNAPSAPPIATSTPKRAPSRGHGPSPRPGTRSR